MFTEDKRNLVIAIVAVVAILIAWQFLLPRLMPDTPPPQPAEQQQAEGVPADQITVEQAAPKIAEEAEVVPRAEALGAGARVTVDAPRLRGSIPLTGARIDDVTLKDYREEAEKDSPPIDLLSPSSTEHPYFAEFGWLPAEESPVELPDRNTVWQTHDGPLTAATPITLTWDNGEGLVFERTIAVDENYLFTVTRRVRNNGAAPVALHPYSLLSRTGTPTSSFYKPWGMFQNGALGVLAGDYREADYGDLRDGDVVKGPSTGGWIGITDKYWLAVLIPDQTSHIQADSHHSASGKTDRYQVEYVQDAITLNPGEVTEVTDHLFAGAKEIAVLDAYEESLGADRFDLAVDFGYVWFLSKPMFYAVDFFNRVTGNFGVAILLLTICVRFLLFPLANKAYASMSRMRKLQPEMMMLRERFKEDKQRMNQEIMGLYRREKANPMAGCLPMVVQIPVFIALYYMLFVTIEMRHAPFFGWIKDLSAPDPWTIITGFGYLDWPAPSFLLVGIWPLFYGLTMWLQMRLNPQPVEPLQQKIMMALPIVLLFVFAQFPAGLVIYWTWNNVLSIGQQWLIYRRLGVTRATLAADAAKIKEIKEKAEKGTLVRPSESRPGERKKRPAGAKTAKSRPATSKAASSKSGARRTTTPTRKLTLKEQAEVYRREKEARKRKKAAERKRAKARTERAGSRKSGQKARPAAETEAAEPIKLSRRERRAARAAKQAETEGAEAKSDQQEREWATPQQDARPRRQAKGKKRAKRN